MTRRLFTNLNEEYARRIVGWMQTEEFLNLNKKRKKKYFNLLNRCIASDRLNKKITEEENHDK